MDRLPELDRIATGENIKRLMRLNHMTMGDLQFAFKFQSANNLYKWSRGEVMPSADNLVKLAHLFNCSVDDILVTEEQP